MDERVAYLMLSIPFVTNLINIIMLPYKSIYDIFIISAYLSLSIYFILSRHCRNKSIKKHPGNRTYLCKCSTVQYSTVHYKDETGYGAVKDLNPVNGLLYALGIFLI